MFLIRWLWKNLEGYRFRYITAMLMSVISQVMFVGNPIIMKIVIDTYVSGEHAAENLALHKDRFIFLIAMTVIVNLARTGIQYGGIMLYEVSSQGALYRVRKYLFDNIQKQDAGFYGYYRTGDIMTRLSGDLDMVRHSLAWIIRGLLECAVCFLSAAVYFMTLDVPMALCLMALTPIVFVISFMFRKKVGPMYGDLRDRLSDLNTAAEENISGNRVVKAFASEDFEKSKFDGYNSDYSRANKKTALLWLKFFLPIETCSQAVQAVHLIAGGIFVIMGRLTLGDYMAFSMLIWTMTGPMSTIGNMINDLQRFTASAYKIIEIYYSRSRITDRADAVEVYGRFKGDVEFRNVSFGYGGYGTCGEENVLTDISFTVKAGQTVAIMGETGSGKTTLVNLIPRIYDVTKGEVLVDGHNVRMLKLNQLRSGIGMATQEVLLYSDTIEGNIAFGDSEMSFDDVKKCALAADADGFIEKTADGYDTIIGERGVGLSGGQKQRVALARALAIKPSILILDDTTSAVDLETEKHIQESLRNLDFPCTKIIIAARISSVKDADCVIVLKDGKIAEKGTHDELIKQDGYYREVYELQS